MRVKMGGIRRAVSRIINETLGFFGVSVNIFFWNLIKDV